MKIVVNLLVKQLIAMKDTLKTMITLIIVKTLVKKNAVFQPAKCLIVLKDLIQLINTVVILLKKIAAKILALISNATSDLFQIQTNNNLLILVNQNAAFQLVLLINVQLDTIKSIQTL